MSSSQTYSPFRSVLLREWRRMTSRRLYLCVCIILPLFTLFFMATIFGNGQMENIPIGIVGSGQYCLFTGNHPKYICCANI